MQSSDYDVETLNDLIGTTIDTVDGYRAAAEDASTSPAQAGFFARANVLESICDKLQDYVVELGSAPVADGAAAVGAHRLFVVARDAALADSDTVTAAEAERSETHLRAKFERALSDADLAVRTRAVVEQTFDAFRQHEGDLKLAA